jgi:putative ABC transport system ATP-binding protein
MRDLIIPMMAVNCRGVTKDFGQGDSKVSALRGVDLDLRPGELTLMVGPSGCGKTTLLSIIAGILEPTTGEVCVLGESLLRMSGAEKIRFRSKHVGFVFQQYNLLPALTAAKNVAVPLVIAGVPKRECIARAIDLLGTMGMAHRVNSLPSQMSGGEQQRVAIARALIHQPSLVVCDEPTAALDAHTGQIIMELLRRIAVQPDRAVAVVTHDSRVFRFADRIAYLNDGRVEQVTANVERDGDRSELEHRPSISLGSAH